MPANVADRHHTRRTGGTVDKRERALRAALCGVILTTICRYTEVVMMAPLVMSAPRRVLDVEQDRASRHGTGYRFNRFYADGLQVIRHSAKTLVWDGCGTIRRKAGRGGVVDAIAELNVVRLFNSVVTSITMSDTTYALTDSPHYRLLTFHHSVQRKHYALYPPHP